MPRVVHFELAADDPERAVQFYQGVFGWKIQKWAGPEDYWLVTTGEPSERGIDGAIMRRRPMGDCVNTVAVTSIVETVASITAHGGKIVMPPDEIPGVGTLAYCTDTEGTLFGVIQNAAPAA
ncbi:MAG: VOC family protein [Chloroflexota bacterium]